jgi:hypothetical protein
MPNTKSVRLGSAYRLYKNSLGKVLAIDTIIAYTDVIPIPASDYDYNAPLLYTEWQYSSYMSYERLYIHLGEGTRTISTIQMFGDYIDIEESSGDYLWAQWAKVNGDVADPTISFEDLPGVGDSL